MSARTLKRTTRRLIGGAISGFGMLLLARDALAAWDQLAPQVGAALGGVPVLLASLSN